MPNKIGRPRLDDARRGKLRVKASDDEKRRLAEIARLNQQTVSDFVREAINEAAADCSDTPIFRVSA